MKRFILAIALLAGTISNLHAERFAGTEPFDFLLLDSGALAASVGGAFSAGGGDANIMAYNPAGLAHQTENHVSLMHHSIFQGVSRDKISLAFRNGFGMSLDSLSFGQIERTTLSNPNGTGLGEFDASAQAIAAGIGWPLSERLTVGWSGKFIRETIDGTRGQAWAADAGLQYQASDEPIWKIGIAAQNIGTKTKFESKSEPLPLTLRWGSALQLNILGRSFGLLTDLEQNPSGRVSPHVGITAIAAPGLSLRLGYNGRNDAGIGITGGFGLAWNSATFDYSIVPSGNLGSSHMLTFGYRWGPRAREAVFSDTTGKFIENNP